MSTDGDMRERHGRVLAELAEAGMAMVRRLGQAMERTEDVQILAQIGLAFHRVSRAVRQTMALEFRLAQDARREALEPTARPRLASPPAQPAAPRPPAERTGWSEYEADDSDEALDALDVLLEAEDLDVEAVHEAVEASGPHPPRHRSRPGAGQGRRPGTGRWGVLVGACRPTHAPGRSRRPALRAPGGHRPRAAAHGAAATRRARPAQLRLT